MLVGALSPVNTKERSAAGKKKKVLKSDSLDRNDARVLAVAFSIHRLVDDYMLEE